jgi:predicted nuclease with RNAse H fold
VRRASETCWAGVDVGGKRKNFHVALVSKTGLLERPARAATPREVVRQLAASVPRVVAVDSPRSYAEPGALSRKDERELVRARICGIRFTPNAEVVRTHPSRYYEWVLNGLALFSELEGASARIGWEVIECFPTASFTRLGGPRGGASRSIWTRRVLERLPVQGLPALTNQDERDAVMAALTARAYDEGLAQAYGEIIVAYGLSLWPERNNQTDQENIPPASTAVMPSEIPIGTSLTPRKP